ncbi:MAG TPA: glycosyltransferase family A protein [Chthoniobacteraceae bacterium]|jgi:glycosyltransferase involved in cell wall biosynthesis
MRISVVIPCFNAARWIAATLRSVAGQSRPPEEILVIDDGSTDDSLEQIRSSGVSVRLLQTQRANGAGARNAGIAAASGDWIALLDADDLWYPDHLERAESLLSGSGDVAYMASHDWIDLQGRSIPIPESFTAKFDAPLTGLADTRFLQLLREPFHFGHSTVLYRLDRLREVGAFDVEQERRHDLDLWLRMIHGHTWTYDSVRTVGYREGTPGSISKAVVSCEYFNLRALLKSRDRFAGNPHFAEEIAGSARRLMGLAFVDGASGEFASARKLAWPYLDPRLRAWYRGASLIAPLARLAMRLRRRVIMRPEDAG